MNCSKCGNMNPENALYCNYCRAKLQQKPKPEGKSISATDKTIMIIIVALLIVLVVGVVIYFINDAGIFEKKSSKFDRFDSFGGGSGVSVEESHQPTEPAADATAQENIEIFSKMPKEFAYSEMRGYWTTKIELLSDGSFEGRFEEDDFGSTGTGYPDGTIYLCSFSGRFTALKKVNDYTYKMNVTDYQSDAQKPEYIQDNIKYVPKAPKAFSPYSEFLIYTPDTPISALPEEFIKSVPWPKLSEYGPDEKLGCYGIYNVWDKSAFLSKSE